MNSLKKNRRRQLAFDGVVDKDVDYERKCFGFKPDIL